MPSAPWLAIVLAAAVAAPTATAQAPPAPAAASLAALVAQQAPRDLDGDGRAELRSITFVAERGAAPAPLVVVLVEPRLWGEPADADVRADIAALRAAVLRHADDLAAEGFRALLVTADVHRGAPHQDGRTVLAMSGLFQRLHAAAPMAGAVLVGHFPDALLVRTCNWRRRERLTLPGRDGVAVEFAPTTTNVRCVPEIVAHRCDLVLADLDGDWERVYVPGPTSLCSATAVFGDEVPPAGGACVALKTGEVDVVDVFHVRDGAAIADRTAFALHLDADDRDRECSAADRTLGNPLARPEIAVSRLDARGVAWSPEPDAIADGTRPAPRHGTDGKPPAAWRWHADDVFERRLLVEYFDRNHAFRTTPLPASAHRPASIAHELGSGLHALRDASPAWGAFAEADHDVHEGADLLALRRWLHLPAVLRTLRAHSDPHGAAFARTDTDALERELGPPWHWVVAGDTRVPSWRDHRGGRADFVFWRALHGDRAIAPYLLLHHGCEAMSPPGAVAHAYDHPAYGKRGHAESILFFTPCLAIVGRAKVFYDDPRGFAAALGEGRTFGEAWQRYFAIEGQAADHGEVGGDIGRKRAYFWSLVGDFTLRLPRVAQR
jgi:hypothetical protein